MIPFPRGRARPLLVATMAFSLAVLSGLPLGLSDSRAAAADPSLGCGSAEVQKTLPNGAAWRMCARIHPIKGLVLEQIEFKPASGSREYSGYLRVIDELYLSQLNVPYDAGHVQYNDITSFGFGDLYLLAQNADTCRGNALDIEQSFTYRGRLVQRTIPGICLNEVETGLATHSAEAEFGDGPRIAAQGTALEVSSLSKISWYEYQQKVVFDDQGGIDVGLGATGDLAPDGAGGPFFSEDASTGWPLGGERLSNGEEANAGSHWHSAIWRVDFGIGGNGDQFVEQWGYQVNEQPGFYAVTKGEGARKTRAFSVVEGDGAEDLRWWRVGNDGSLNPDEHARSYEIVNKNTSNESVAVTKPLLSFTNDLPCAEYASDNLNAGCAGASLLDYVADDDGPLVDPVAWVNVGFHHVVRDEDQSPMPVHWQSFSLMPRDFFAQSPSVGDSRSCINGPPGDSIDSVNKPCIATNVLRPKVTSSAQPVAPGATLTAGPGLWNINRTTWNYSFLWFRGGEPTTITGNQYAVTEADLGKEVVVKVTASQVGFASGTAESNPLLVPDPRPTPTPTTPSPTASPTPTKPSPTVKPGRKVAHIKAPSTVKVKSGKTASIKVQVWASGTIPAGRVAVVRGSKKATAKLVKGKVRLRVPKIKTPGRYRFELRYGGSSKISPQKKVLYLVVRKR